MPSGSTYESLRCFHAVTAVRLESQCTADIRTVAHAANPKQIFSSTFMRASGPVKLPVSHSSKLRWKIAPASAPPYEATPGCLVAVTSTAISPPLTARSRLVTHVRRKSPIWMGRTLVESTSATAAEVLISA